jgi:hypothetical protein
MTKKKQKKRGEKLPNIISLDDHILFIPCLLCKRSREEE